MIPGSNLLNRALSIINNQSAQWYKFLGRTTNEIGNQISQYDAPVLITGSLQPTDRSLVQQLGLNLEITYFTFYTSNIIVDLERDSSGDQLVINGKQYQCESITPWNDIDGWCRVICRFVGTSSF